MKPVKKAPVQSQAAIVPFKPKNLDLPASKLLQKIVSVPSDVALSVTSNSLLETVVLFPRYQRAVDRHQVHLPQLSEHDQQIVHDLETNGVSVTSLAALDLANSNKLLDSAQVLSMELELLSRQPAYCKQHTLTASADKLLRYPEIFYWGLDKRLLAIAESYLKLPVAYDGLSYYYSIADAQEAGPRKWHRDKEDWRMLKVCVYVNSVNQEGGPFECVRPANNSYLVETADYYQVLLHHQIKQLLKTDSENWYRSYPGMSGTVIFVDTARFYHRGRAPITQDRSAIFFSYFSSRPKNPFFCGRSPFSQLELRQLAHSLPDYQRQAVLWRDQLPGLGRWVPKNRVTV